MSICDFQVKPQQLQQQQQMPQQQQPSQMTSSMSMLAGMDEPSTQLHGTGLSSPPTQQALILTTPQAGQYHPFQMTGPLLAQESRVGAIIITCKK